MKKYVKKTDNPNLGRRKKEIDKSVFEKLCALQCTKDEIASFFECSGDTLSRWCERIYKATFAEVYKEKGSMGKISLRRYQFNLAERNSSMAIWLGKQYLKQTDKVEKINEDNGLLPEFLDYLKGEKSRNDNENKNAGD
jgi:hypothetical protein